MLCALGGSGTVMIPEGIRVSIICLQVALSQCSTYNTMSGKYSGFHLARR